MAEIDREQVVKVGFGDLVDEVGGHGRELDEGTVLDLVAGDADLFALGIGQD